MLAFLSGFSSAWLGVGGSVLIVPLLPVLSPLSALASAQVSLCTICSISFINVIAFFFERLILWSWVFRGLIGALSFAFLSGAFLNFLTSFQIRFILWFFLLLILLLQWGLRRSAFLKMKGFYFFSSLMGVCSGFTGLGGGMILSPFLHESQIIPAKSIPAVSACIMSCVGLFALFGQISQKGLSFIESPDIFWSIYLSLFLPSVLGLFFGHIVNLKQKNILWRRWILRIAVLLMFLKMTFELVFWSET